MAYYGNIQEEELKNKVAHDLFDGFDTTRIIGHIDFCVSMPPDLFGAATEPNAQNELRFSKEANDVMDAGRNLWRYYHEQPIAKTRPNASFYDIRLYFQGTKTTKSGKVQMCPESSDAHYTELITDLRQKMKLLAKKIEPKVYEYGFLKE